MDYVLREAALGSVPRSIEAPITTNENNVTGFLNMLVAARDARVRRFVYAASSSTYGDHPGLPKVEDVIGKLLSPYAVTKYVNRVFCQNVRDGSGWFTLFQCLRQAAGPRWGVCGGCPTVDQGDDSAGGCLYQRQW